MYLFLFFLYFRIRLYVYIATMGGQLRWTCCPFWQPSIRLYYMYIVLCFIVWLINFLSSLSLSSFVTVFRKTVEACLDPPLIVLVLV